MKKFYTYIWRTPVEISIKNQCILAGSIFYVGKGSGRRSYRHLNDISGTNELKETVIRRIRQSGTEPIVEHVKENITEKEAFLIEKELIHSIGQIIHCTGSLTNLTSGGEGTSGIIRSDKYRENLSKIHTGKIPWNKGSTAKTDSRISTAGRPRGIKWSEANRAMYEEIRMQPGYYNFLQDSERCRKISESNKGRAGASKDKVWYNNGHHESYYYNGEEPNGYSKGRLSRISKPRGKSWFNNGTMEKLFVVGTEDEGFKRGRLCKK